MVLWVPRARPNRQSQLPPLSPRCCRRWHKREKAQPQRAESTSIASIILLTVAGRIPWSGRRWTRAATFLESAGSACSRSARLRPTAAGGTPGAPRHSRATLLPPFLLCAQNRRRIADSPGCCRVHRTPRAHRGSRACRRSAHHQVRSTFSVSAVHSTAIPLRPPPLPATTWRCTPFVPLPLKPLLPCFQLAWRRSISVGMESVHTNKRT